MSCDLPEAPILLLNVQDVKTQLCAKSGAIAIYSLKIITNKLFFPVKAFDPCLKLLERFQQVNTVRYILSISRCGGLRVRRLLLVGFFSCGILGCDSTSGDSIPASAFGYIRGFDSSSLAIVSHVGHGAEDASSLVC